MEFLGQVLVQGENKVLEVPLHVIHLDQDDPRKCTARKLHSIGLVQMHDSSISSPRRGFLLDPQTDVVFGPEDRALAKMGGSLVALDCSWKQIDLSLLEIKGRTKLQSRKLPKLLPANSVSWGKIGRLSSAEALAASLSILGFEEQAMKVLEKFQFGEEFLNLNKEPLLAYSQAGSREDMGIIERQFFDV